MKYEKPLSGNPNQLAVNQHVLPRASIVRFANGSGKVDVNRSGRVFSASPDDPNFCARRSWDQRAEEAYHGPEGKFQELAARIIGDPAYVLAADDQELANVFFALVCARTRARRNRIQDQPLPGASAVKAFPKDAREKLEKMHYVTLNERGGVPGRMVTGSLLSTWIEECRSGLEARTWQIARSDNLELLVSDSIDRVQAIPISPTVLLALGKGGTWSEQEVADHNAQVGTEHDCYYFARDFACTEVK
ncbi:MAG: hypothetical protein QOJ65_2323 [Fimbriimonadaceae bacterium]|jgi:hypothetical protein|nr:hypothetical protein [Fimbriimonadaceae bacterium]